MAFDSQVYLETTVFEEALNRIRFVYDNCDDVIVSINTLSEDLGFDGLDEQKIIERLCGLDFYDCIGDMCMGKGLVGFYANINGKKFVGTELNEKRLAVLIERIKTGRIIMK